MQTGWVTFKDEGICMVTNMNEVEHPRYVADEAYCSWIFDHELMTVYVEWDMDTPIYLLDDATLEWTENSWMSRGAMDVGECLSESNSLFPSPASHKNHEDGSCTYCEHTLLQCCNPRPYVPAEPYTKEVEGSDIPDNPLLDHAGKWIIDTDNHVILLEDTTVIWHARTDELGWHISDTGAWSIVEEKLLITDSERQYELTAQDDGTWL